VGSRGFEFRDDRVIVGLFRLCIRSLLSLHYVEVKDIVMTYYVFLFFINNIFKIFSLSGLAQPKSARKCYYHEMCYY
jgi:hypothetical protein